MDANGFPLLSEINEDHVYLYDVLGLEYGDSEDRLIDRIKDQAKSQGVDLDLDLEHDGEAGVVRFDSPSTTGRHSPLTVSSEIPRRSVSVDSQSTGLTSLDSGLSRNNRNAYSKWTRARGILTSRDLDTCRGRNVVEPRPSISSTPPLTPSTSLCSLPITPIDVASPKKSGSRRIKALAALKLVRSDSSPSGSNDQCSHHPSSDVALSQRSERPVHRLPCGHVLCTSAFRELIRSSTIHSPGAAPVCCGRPIPRRLIEHVLAEPEKTHALEIRCKSHRNDSASSVPSLRVETRPSLSPPKQHLGIRPASASSSLKQQNGSPVDTSTPHLSKHLAWLSKEPSYMALYDDQVALLKRFNVWASNRQAQLSNHHKSLLTNLQQTHEATTTSLIEAHAIAVSEAEDKQVAAEAELRVHQEQEKRDSGTALQHMVAYCAGTYRSTGEAHGRVVTEQDRGELEKALRVRGAMDARHVSAINVLRGEQGRRMKARLLRQEREVQDLVARQAAEVDGLQRDFQSAVQALNEGIEARRRRVGERWEWTARILAREIESATGPRGEKVDSPPPVPPKNLFVYVC